MSKRTSIILICVLSLCVCLTGCVSRQSPGDQVEMILNHVKDVEIEEGLKEYFDTKDLGKKYADDYQELIDKITDFDFKVVDEDINEDKTEATVKVRITTYDYQSAYDAAEKDIVEKAKKGKLDRDSDVQDYSHKALFKELLSLKSKDKKTDVTINCTINEDGDWTPDVESSKELVDAILGGIITEQKLKVKIKE